MSSWADAVGMGDDIDSTPPPPEMTKADLTTGLTALRTSLAGAAEALRQQRAAEESASDLTIYRGDGPEPPPHVTRLRFLEHDDPDDIVRAKTGKGWWWMNRRSADASPSFDDGRSDGWAWEEMADSVYKGRWQVIPASTATGRRPVSEPPPPGVLRVRAYNKHGKRIRSDEDTIVRCVGGGWWWVGPTHGHEPDTYGWFWGGGNMESVHEWEDATSPEDTGRFLGMLPAYRIGGTKPSEDVVRLRVEPPTGRDDYRELARNPEDEDQWVWTARAQVPDFDDAVDWYELEPDGLLLVATWPVVAASKKNELCTSLVDALPWDNAWHWIGMDDDGVRVWGRLDEDGDWSLIVQSPCPADDNEDDED